MRDINECKAEVFLRSEKRIKEKKMARKRALICCAPICICLIISSAMIPSLMPKSKTDMNENVAPPQEEMAPSDLIGNESDKGSSKAYIKIEITKSEDASQYYSTTNKEDITKISNIIKSTFDDIKNSSPEASDKPEEFYPDDIYMTEYMITLIAENGSSLSYKTNLHTIQSSSGKAVLIEAEEAHQLKALITEIIDKEN